MNLVATKALRSRVPAVPGFETTADGGDEPLIIAVDGLGVPRLKPIRCRPDQAFALPIGGACRYRRVLLSFLCVLASWREILPPHSASWRETL
jgi:hypothetical protein